MAFNKWKMLQSFFTSTTPDEDLSQLEPLDEDIIRDSIDFFCSWGALYFANCAQKEVSIRNSIKLLRRLYNALETGEFPGNLTTHLLWPVFFLHKGSLETYAAIREELGAVSLINQMMQLNIRHGDRSLLDLFKIIRPIYSEPLPLFKDLLDGGVHNQVLDTKGHTTLHYAAILYPHHQELIRMLIERGANLSTRNIEGRTYLDCCPPEESKEQLYPMQYLTYMCWAKRTILVNKVPFSHLPNPLKQYLCN